MSKRRICSSGSGETTSDFRGLSGAGPHQQQDSSCDENTLGSHQVGGGGVFWAQCNDTEGFLSLLSFKQY